MRLVVIWFQLMQFEEKHNRGKFFRKLMSATTSGTSTTVIILVVNILLFIGLYTNPGHLVLNKPGLDWFDPEGQLRYKLFPLDYIFICEALLVGGALYLVRYSELTKKLSRRCEHRKGIRLFARG